MRFIDHAASHRPHEIRSSLIPNEIIKNTHRLCTHNADNSSIVKDSYTITANIMKNIIVMNTNEHSSNMNTANMITVRNNKNSIISNRNRADIDDSILCIITGSGESSDSIICFLVSVIVLGRDSQNPLQLCSTYGIISCVTCAVLRREGHVNRKRPCIYQVAPS